MAILLLIEVYPFLFSLLTVPNQLQVLFVCYVVLYEMRQRRDVRERMLRQKPSI